MPRNKQLEDATSIGLAHSVAQALEPKLRALAMGEEQTRQIVEAMAPAIGQLIGELRPQLMSVQREQQRGNAMMQTIAGMIPPDHSQQLSRLAQMADTSGLEQQFQALALQVAMKPEAWRFEIVRDPVSKLIESVEVMPLAGSEDEVVEVE